MKTRPRCNGILHSKTVSAIRASKIEKLLLKSKASNANAWCATKARLGHDEATPRASTAQGHKPCLRQTPRSRGHGSTVQEKVIYNRNHQGMPVLDNPVLMLCMATASAALRAVMQTDLFGQQLPRSALEACSQPRARFWKLIPERKRSLQCFKQKSCWTDPVSDTGLIR